jgi:CRP-like cAMP-binding protein/glyoxylase-like metal-dependent hydrolase (beta-lactamase superfamily II)
MSLDVHRPYPGVALVTTERGSALLGAPADAFKATKAYCQQHDLPFPRVLIAPTTLLVEATPQFNPEFFLYDFLFVYGAAFKPELANERLVFVLDEGNVEAQKKSLRMTLVGPTREEMSGYRDSGGQPILDSSTVDRLAAVAEHMAIKKGGRARTVDDMVEIQTFGNSGAVEVLDGTLRIRRDGPFDYRVSSSGAEARVDLSIVAPVVPFATLPVPAVPDTPVRFGIKPLGTRSGFDLSGPTTGFVIWVNGQAVIYDGPVGTRWLLERQGISPEDIHGVILSHCHEDHMGAFVDLILAGQRPKVFTAEPIYRSALTKLASYFRRPESEVAGFIDYHPITPGEPLDTLGATFDFFYTVHAIPTIGVSVSMRSAGGSPRSVMISGDTMHHDGLDEMKSAGVLTEEAYEQMRHLVPDASVDGAVYLTDVGEAIIHGHPKDWQGNPNSILYYHCPDNEHTRSFGHDLAVPGKAMTLIEAGSLHPATPARLLNALRFLDISDPGWFATILFQGTSRTADPGDVLVAAGQTDASSFAVIVSGSAAVLDEHGDEVAILRPGEFFGAIELVDENGEQTATVRAETPMELFEIDARLFHDYIREAGLDETVRRVWSQRPMVESAKIFKRLDLSLRNRIAKVAAEERYNAGDRIVEAGKLGDDFYLLVEGEVEVEAKGETLAHVRAEDADNFFGEMEAIFPNRPRLASVLAKTAVRLLRIQGQQVRELFEGEMGVRYSLSVAIHKRGG